MLIIALTGGIGSGKSAVANLFAQHAVPVIDTDLIARELVQKGQPALHEIVNQFGPQVLTQHGELDRSTLRNIIFNDAVQRTKLEAILHPRIHAEVYRRINTLKAPYCLIVVPLLAETKQTYQRDRTVVVDTSPDIQLQRIMARDVLTQEQAQSILSAQASRDKRLALADDVIDNSGPPFALTAQVDQLHHHYLKLASTALPH